MKFYTDTLFSPHPFPRDCLGILGPRSFSRRSSHCNSRRIGDLSFNRISGTGIVECSVRREDVQSVEEKGGRMSFQREKNASVKRWASRRLVSLATSLPPRTSGALNIAICSHGSLAACSRVAMGSSVKVELFPSIHCLA